MSQPTQDDMFSRVFSSVASTETDHGKITIGDVVLLILDAGLLVYTAYRSWHFLSGSLPAEYEILAVIGLVGIDFAFIAWTLVLIFGSATEWQDYICYAMLALTGIGMVLTSLADSIGVNNLPALFQLITLYSVYSLIVLNVIIGVIYHIISPNAQAKRAERRSRVTLQRMAAEARRQLAERKMRNVLAGQMLALLGDVTEQEEIHAQKKIGIDDRTAQTDAALKAAASRRNQGTPPVITPEPIAPFVTIKPTNGADPKQ